MPKSKGIKAPKWRVSLRLGHARGLTVHRTVIQYPRAASLPERAEALFAQAEKAAKVKFERLKKLVDFYG